MAINSGNGGLVTDVSTTPQNPLGSKWLVTPATAVGSKANMGDQEWIYVKMTGAAAAVGSVLARAAGTSAYEVVLAPVTTTHVGRIVGVAQHAIAQDSYGWVLRDGVGQVLADATGYAADLGLIISGTTAGTVDSTATVTNAVIGTSIVASAGSPALGTARIACLG
jgi:hypothetical protein